MRLLRNEPADQTERVFSGGKSNQGTWRKTKAPFRVGARATILCPGTEKNVVQTQGAIIALFVFVPPAIFFTVSQGYMVKKRGN